MTKVLRNALYGAPSPGILVGMNGSTAGASTSLTVSAGFCTDATRQVMIKLATALTKTTAAWAAGNNQGGGDGSALPANGTVHWYAIANLSTGADEVIWSTNASAPALPSGYGFARRIFSWFTVSSQWALIIQNADDFDYSVVVGVTSTSYSVSTPLTVPTPAGIVTLAKLSGFVTGVTLGNGIKLQPMDVVDTGFGVAGNLSSLIPSGSGYGTFVEDVRTNTSQQVRMFVSSPMNISMACRGWTDTRGRFT